MDAQRTNATKETTQNIDNYKLTVLDTFCSKCSLSPCTCMGSNMSISNIESLSGHTNVSPASSVNKNNLSNVAPDEPLLLHVNETQTSCFDVSTVNLKLCKKKYEYLISKCSRAMF